MQGIYKITNIENRWKQHQEALEKGVHHSYKLQRCYDQLSDKNILQYDVVELVDNILDMPEREMLNSSNSLTQRCYKRVL